MELSKSRAVFPLVVGPSTITSPPLILIVPLESRPSPVEFTYSFPPVILRDGVEVLFLAPVDWLAASVPMLKNLPPFCTVEPSDALSPSSLDVTLISPSLIVITADSIPS